MQRLPPLAPSFARVFAPLNVRVEKDQPFEFELNVVELDVFQYRKERLMSPPILALRPHGQRYNVDKIACDCKLACALLQHRPNGYKPPVIYWSKSLAAPEKYYLTTEKECRTEV